MPSFAENINTYIGRTVKINISHKIYGKQQVTIRSFQPFCNKEKVGFFINNREFYVRPNEIENIEINNNTIYINGLMQDITISVIK